jgi:hypothetical protein
MLGAALLPKRISNLVWAVKLMAAYQHDAVYARADEEVE